MSDDMIGSLWEIWTENTTLREAITTAIGAASVCWDHPEGAGVFRPDWAAQIASELEDFIRAQRVPTTD